MPTVAEIEAASPITSAQAYRLTAKVRSSLRYQAAPQFYTTLAEDIDALVGVDSIASRHLSAISDALDTLGDGTVGVKGGKYGADYSQSRDREDLLNEVLDALFDLGDSSSLVNYFGSTNLANTPVY